LAGDIKERGGPVLEERTLREEDRVKKKKKKRGTFPEGAKGPGRSYS